MDALSKNEKEAVFGLQAGAEISDLVVISNSSRCAKTLEVLTKAGCLVAASDNLDEAIKVLSDARSHLVILDADCCSERYLEHIEQIGKASPESIVAFLLGWWDERAPYLSGLSRHFLYRPFSKRQVEQFLSNVICTYSAFELPA